MEHLRITVAGKVYDVRVEKIEGHDTDSTSPAPVAAAAPAAKLPTPAAAPAAAPTHPWQPPRAAKTPSSGDATSPLAGIVQAIEREVGAQVAEGDLVLTLEAMKMYTSINAPTSGTITAIHVKVGDAVDEGQVLYTIG